MQLTPPNIDIVKPNAFNETYFPEINGLTFEKHLSEEVFAPFFQPLFDVPKALYVVVGTDSGLLYDYVKRQNLPEDCFFVFIEFNNVIQKLGQRADELESLQSVFSANPKKVWLFNHDVNLVELHRFFQSYVILRQVFMSQSIAAKDAKPGSSYQQLSDQIEQQLITLDKIEQPFDVKQTFERERFLNAAHNLQPVSCLGKAFDGCEVVVIGGGPTLDDSINWIRANQQKLIIIAAARVAKRLKTEKIKVDFFVSVDPYEWSFNSSLAMLEHYEHSVLFYSYYAQHRLISQWLGASAYLGEKFGWVNADNKRETNIEGRGPTVTNAQLHIAVMLGAKKVFLAGVDFCFAKGQTHESSSSEASTQNHLIHDGKIRVEDNAGQWTETREDFYLAKVAMDQSLEAYRAFSDVEVISLGLHSAQLNYVAYQPLKHIQLLSTDKTGVLQGIKKQLYLPLTEKCQKVEQTLLHLKQQQKRFVNLKKATAELVSTAPKVYRSGVIVDKAAKKFDKLQKKAQQGIGEDNEFITRFHAELFADGMREELKNQTLSHEQTLKQVAEYYQSLHTVSQELLELIQTGLKRCQLRVDELSSNKKIPKICPQWHEWNEQGRAIEWTQNHGEPSSEQDQLLLAQALEDYEQLFELADRRWHEVITENTFDLAKIFNRANLAFSQKNLVELKTILQHLSVAKAADNSPEGITLEGLKNYTLAMQAELEGEPVKAFNLYEPISDELIRNEALPKMLSIAMSLQDHSVALTVLERLVVINLEYMINYADLLVLLENRTGAIEVLTMYLQQHPTRLDVKNKLAQWYLEEKQFDAAQSILQQVLEQDSNNRMAQSLIKQCQRL